MVDEYSYFQVYVWAVDDLYLHNFKAICCRNPERKLKKQNIRLWNRLQRIIDEENCDPAKIEYIDWFGVVKTSSFYQAGR